MMIGNDSASCIMTGFDITGIEPPAFTARVFS